MCLPNVTMFILKKIYKIQHFDFDLFIKSWILLQKVFYKAYFSVLVLKPKQNISIFSLEILK